MKRRALAGLASAFVLMAACDIPTTTPNWDMTWNVPANSTTIGVTSFLPSGVTLAPGGGAFNVTASAASTTVKLSDYCGVACNGTGPKPAFTPSPVVAVTSLPASLGNAVLGAGSTISVSFTNNFGFDLLNPAGAAAPGAMTITVTNGTTTLGTLTLNGSAGNSVPTGVSTRSIPLSGTVNGALPITVTTSITTSPAGSSVTMTGESQLIVSGTPTVSVVSASVALSNQPVSSTSTLDLKDIDSTVSDRVNSGSFIATVVNPFAASGTLTIAFTGGTVPVNKSITLDAGASSATTSVKTVDFTKDELQALLGHTITVTIGGSVSGGTVAVTPAQVVAIDTRLQLNVSTKSSK